MNYELYKKLKDAGFSQSPYMNQLCQHPDSMSCRLKSSATPECNWVSVPTLSELIEACGDSFLYLNYAREEGDKHWLATSLGDTCKGWGNTPEEAVAELWLLLNKKI